jgi:nitric oxide reductase subunit B
MQNNRHFSEILSPWWRHTVIIVMVVGFTILIWLSVRTYSDAPPIPARVASTSGKTIFTGEDILSGQQVFLKYGLMENGTVWGHGAYLGPDFSAEYLHALSIDASQMIGSRDYSKDVRELTTTEQNAVNSQVQQLLKGNRYDWQSQTLTFTEAEAFSFERQLERWTEYFSQPTQNAGLPVKYINDRKELQQLTTFFAWTAWASAVNRPGKSYSYTNNFPYDSVVGNTPTSDAVFWSALSLITLLGATALGLFAVGRFNYLGWKGQSEHIHPQLIPGVSTPSQKATVKYFVIVALLFLAQVLVGGGTAHYRADPGSFFGIDLSRFFPSNILRTWHLQLAILWVATAYVAGGLFFAPSLGEIEPKGQSRGVHVLFGALVIVSVGSLFGEWFGIHQLLGTLWFWIGHQGWEYLDLGRLWQILLAVGLAFWVYLLFRGIAPARKNPEQREISSLFLYAAVAIPLFISLRCFSAVQPTSPLSIPGASG